MIAEYNEQFYMANIRDKEVILITRDQGKVLEGFESRLDYFYKRINIDDSNLNSVYEIHFYVKYKDSVEDTDIWLVDAGRPVGFIGNIENEEVVIDVSHSPKDDTWVQYERGAASKIIKLTDCTEFIVEEIYLKRDGKLVDRMVDKKSVSILIFTNLFKWKKELYH